MGWLANKFDKWASGSQEKELNNYTVGLRGMDGSEIGLIVAVATHQRHLLVAEGFNVMDPINFVSVNPMATYRLSQTIQSLQKERKYQAAAGLMVWVHTLRAATRPELRLLGREMWRELQRGFPYVEESALDAQIVMGLNLNVHDALSFPIGLAPNPS